MLYNAMRANRTFATEDSNMRVQFTINDKPMGSVLTVTAGAKLRIAVAIEDADPSAHVGYVSGFVGL